LSKQSAKNVEEDPGPKILVSQEKFEMRNAVKHGMVFLVVLVCTVIAAQAQSLSAADRDKALKYLESTKQGVADATKGLSPAQWNFKPAPDKWSIAEVTEHIAAAEDYLRGMVVEKVMVGPARPAGENVAEIDEMILKMIPDRSHPAQAPDPLKPTNRFGSPEASLKHFMETRTTTEDFLNKTQDLRDHAIDSPFGKKLDGYEWILFIAAHSDRHTKQIQEVKSNPNFPKT
jgi:DinB family protein